MDAQLSQDACLTAAKWWAAFLARAPQRENGTGGADADSSIAAEGPRALPSEAAVLAFTRVLSESLWTDVQHLHTEAPGGERRRLYFGVDYDPDERLERALGAAGIRFGTAGMHPLPWKTRMTLEIGRDGAPERVFVRSGRGGERQEVWSSPGTPGVAPHPSPVRS